MTSSPGDQQRPYWLHRGQPATDLLQEHLLYGGSQLSSLGALRAAQKQKL